MIVFILNVLISA